MNDDKLAQLEQMLKDGTISKEEYEAKKKELNIEESKTNSKTKKKSNKKTIIIIVCIIVGVLIICGIVGSLMKVNKTNNILKSFDDIQEDIKEKEESGEFYNYQLYKNFTEDGLAWLLATYNIDYVGEDYFVCINKNGETILQYKKYDYNDAPDGIRDVTSFNNNIAIITDCDYNKIAIDKDGNTIIAEGDENCTEILSEDTTLGYVIVKKTEESYIETKDLYGVVDNTGKFVIPLSEENADPYGKNGLRTIATGIFRDGSNIINLETGAIAESDLWYGDNFWKVENKIIQRNGDYEGSMIAFTADDLKECGRKKFKDIKEVGTYSENKIFMEYEIENDQTKRGFLDTNFEEVIDLSELEITNKPIFKDGYAGLVIRDNWYTVIDEKGEMQFEPVKVDGNPLCFNLGNKRFYIEIDGKGRIIDEKNNTVSQLKTKMKSDNGTYYYSNGYIVNTSGELVNTDGETLSIYMKK